MPKVCALCQSLIAAGDRLLPLPGAQGVAHVHCGAAHGVPPPLCRHWVKGRCLSGTQCFFSHPPHAKGSPPEPETPTPKPPTRKSLRKPRVDVNNKFRASVFRRFLWDTYGPQRLGRGSGLADIASGKGLLAFEFRNLSGIPCFTVDPRPVDIEKQAKWLAGGLYHKVNPIFRDSILRSLAECQASGPLRAPHLRMALTPAVVACVAYSPAPVPSGPTALLLPLYDALLAACLSPSAPPQHGDEDQRAEDAEEWETEEPLPSPPSPATQGTAQGCPCSPPAHG